jgi:hypothetical protein
MSKILPVILLVGGLYYFSTTVSGESSDDDSDDGNGNENPPGTDPPITPIPGCPPIGENKIWVEEQKPLIHMGTSDALNDIHIYEVTTNQENYYPGTQVDITWEAKVKNKSKSRCGEWAGINKTCWFAPTDGTALGDYEGPLNWTIYLIKPDGTQYDFRTEPGNKFFQGYTDSDLELSNAEKSCKPADCLKVLKGNRAKYQVAFQLNADAPVGQYSIRFHAPYGDSDNFATWTQIPAFEVLSSDCNPEGFSAESTKINYETRFASNHDFMLY